MKTSLSVASLAAAVLVTGGSASAQHHHHHDSPVLYAGHGGAGYGGTSYGGGYQDRRYEDALWRVGGGLTHRAAKPAVVQFGGFSDVDDLAASLELQINEFLLDLNYNYSHNRSFQVTYGEAYELYDVAKYIHAAAHHYDRRAIRAKLAGMDSLFHHVHDDVRGWSRHDRRQIGELGIMSKMERIEATLHDLMNDVGVRLSDTPTTSAVAEIAPRPIGY